MSDIHISIPAGEAKRLLTGGKYCPDDIVAEAVGGDTDAAFEAGRQAEHKAFWDECLRENAMDFSFRFAGMCWTDLTFNPTNDIIPPYGAVNNMFCNSRITDLEAILKRNNVIFDVSRCGRYDYAFGYCKVTVCIPEIVIGSNTTTISHMFTDCLALHTIRKLYFPAKTLVTTNAFYGCQALVNLTIGGTIAATGIDMHWSTLLSRDSITSVIGALSDTTTGMAITFSQAAVDAAFTDAEWSALEATKPNWTISLA